jgi:hypothetical protein
VLDPDRCAVVASLLGSSPPDGLLAYVGLGPGQEFIPYFLALVAWVGAACVAVLQWPVASLLRRLRRDPPTAHPPAEAPPELSAAPDASVHRGA